MPNSQEVIRLAEIIQGTSQPIPLQVPLQEINLAAINSTMAAIGENRRETAMNAELIGDANRIFEYVVRNYRNRFHQYGSSNRVACQAIFTAIRRMILTRIINDPETNADTRDFVSSNLEGLATTNIQDTDQISGIWVRSRELLCSLVDLNHIAWRNFDLGARVSPIWPNLIDGNDRIQERVAYYFLAITDPDIIDASKRQELQDNFIAQLASIRRAHNECFEARSPEVRETFNNNTINFATNNDHVDNISCEPGHITRIALMGASHPNPQLIPEFLAITLNDAVNAVITRHFSRSLDSIRTLSESVRANYLYSLENITLLDLVNIRNSRSIISAPVFNLFINILHRLGLDGPTYELSTSVTEELMRHIRTFRLRRGYDLSNPVYARYCHARFRQSFLDPNTYMDPRICENIFGVDSTEPTSVVSTEVPAGSNPQPAFDGGAAGAPVGVVPARYDAQNEYTLGNVFGQNLDVYMSRPDRGTIGIEYRLTLNTRNTQSEGPYSHIIDMPNVPIIHPYEPLGAVLQYDPVTDSYRNGTPSFPIAIRFPGGTLNNLPAGIREQLIEHNIPMDGLEVFFCAQNMPWDNTEELLFRPQPWLHADAPHSQAGYNQASNILVGIMQVNGRMNQLGRAGASTHAEAGGLVVYSPDNMAVRGLGPIPGGQNDLTHSHAFYSMCIKLRTDEQGVNRAALTLHWLLNQNDYDNLSGRIQLTPAGLKLGEILDFGRALFGGTFREIDAIPEVFALQCLGVGGQPAGDINANRYRLAEQPDVAPAPAQQPDATRLTEMQERHRVAAERVRQFDRENEIRRQEELDAQRRNRWAFTQQQQEVNAAIAADRIRREQEARLARERTQQAFREAEARRAREATAAAERQRAADRACREREDAARQQAARDAAREAEARRAREEADRQAASSQNATQRSRMF